MKLEFSFPTKITLLVGLVIVLPIVYFITSFLARGTIYITSPTPGAYVVDIQKEIKYTLPARITERSGRRTFSLEAPGYASRTERYTIFPFYLTRRFQFSLEKKLYFEEDPGIAQKVLLGDLLPRVEDGIYDIGFPTEEGVYPITLRINESWFADEEAYRQALKEAKSKALDWIRSQNVNPDALKIMYLPYDPG